MNGKALKIFLVCLILALSLLDAPEYIRCTHLGLCEFLEFCSHFSNTSKSDLTEHHPSWISIDTFFSILEGLKNSRELIKDPTSYYIPAILTFFKFPYIPINRETLYLKNIELSYPSIENSTSSPILRLIEISVIRS